MDQIDHMTHGRGKLLCPICLVGQLEGAGSNDGIRTMYHADGGVAKVVYARFKCKNPLCQLDRAKKKGTSALDKSFMDFNFPSSVQRLYPFVFSNSTGPVYSHSFIDSLNFSFPTGVSLKEIENHFRAMQVRCLSFIPCLLTCDQNNPFLIQII